MPKVLKKNSYRNLEKSSLFPFSHSPKYSRTTRADGLIFESTFQEYDEALNALHERNELFEEQNRSAIGSLQWFCIKTDDPRYALANGGELKRDEYTILNQKMQELEYPYGAGDGSTTFNLPDLMSARRFVRSVDKEVKNVGQVQEDTMQLWESDLCDVMSGERYESAKTKKGFTPYECAPLNAPQGAGSKFHVYYTLSNKEAGLRTSEENRPVNMALLPYIRVK